jgi:hypothetical protein
MNRFRRWILLSVLAIAIFLLTSMAPNFEAWISRVNADESVIPTIPYAAGNKSVNLPDWSAISFSSLPAISSSGSFELPSNLLDQLGYDPSRAWSAGQTADQFMMMGDVQDAFHTEAFSLEQISDLSGFALSNLNLNDFNLGGQQTIASLSNAIPGLENLQVSQISPLASLLSSTFASETDSQSIIRTLAPLVATTGLSKVTGTIPTDLSSISGLLSNADQLTTLLMTDLDSVDLNSLLSLTIGDLLEQHPYLSSLIPLNAIDLSSFPISSIPGLDQVSLSNLANWQQQLIGQIPGLNQIPFSLMPNALSLGAELIATADVMWEAAEYGDPNVRDSFFVSGTGGPHDDTTQIVPCEVGAPCSYVELDDGKRWASGETQMVSGGYGVLEMANGGKEPTGRLVYGRLFKVVVTETHEAEGTADTGLYFRICHHVPIDLGCTPYFIGAVPWLPIQEKSPIVVLGIQQYNYDADPCQVSTCAPTSATNNPSPSSPGNGQSGTSTGNLQSPVPGAPTTSEYGGRESPCAGCSSFHKGLDFGVGEGTPVGAADGGTVIYAGWFSGYGNTVIVDHGNGMMTLYAHLSEMDAGVGSQVAQGQTIARSGQTGIGTGAHLHFEVITGATPGDYYSGTSVNPRDYVQF